MKNFTKKQFHSENKKGIDAPKLGLMAESSHAMIVILLSQLKPIL